VQAGKGGHTASQIGIPPKKTVFKQKLALGHVMQKVSVKGVMNAYQSIGSEKIVKMIKQGKKEEEQEHVLSLYRRRNNNGLGSIHHS